jgi:hypothetical protein
LIGFFLLMLLIFVSRDLIVWVVMFMVTIIVGIFGFSFQFIC